jgi:hypothetical protein
MSKYDQKQNRICELESALRAVLLFYTVGPWDDLKRNEWELIIGTKEATTKVLCNHIRSVLDRRDRIQ